MGFLDRAKKLAEQAKDLATEAVEKARAQSSSSDAADGDGAPASDPAFGTPAGAIGDAWKNLGLPDPAAVLPAADRDRHGIPSSTKSVVVREAYGVGRRWVNGEKSAGLFWLIDPDAPPSAASGTGDRWSADRPADASDVSGVGDAAYVADLGDGHRGVFVREGSVACVVEVAGLDDDAATDLARATVGRMTHSS
jgi:hypothetical protein